MRVCQRHQPRQEIGNMGHPVQEMLGNGIRSLIHNAPVAASLEVEHGLQKEAAVPCRGGAEETVAGQGLRLTEKLPRQRVPLGAPRF